jgi:hypothetical protein
MSVYTVHEPPLKFGNAPDAARVAFVRDGFHFWAFLLGPVWMIWHGLWLVTLGYAIFIAAVSVALFVLKIHGGAYFAIAFLIALLVGFEASTLRRWTLRRNGWREAAAVVGDDQESAERRFFSAWVEGAPSKQPAPARPLPQTGAPRSTPSDVLGLFPEPGGPR